MHTDSSTIKAIRYHLIALEQDYKQDLTYVGRMVIREAMRGEQQRLKEELNVIMMRMGKPGPRLIRVLPPRVWG